MKKSIIAIAALFIGATAYGQDAYASFGVGYGLGLPGQVIGTSVSIDGNGDATTTNLYGSLGQGVGLNLGAGIMLTDNFGLELGVQYFAGSEITLSETSNGIDGSSDESKGQSNQVRVLPQLVVSSNNDAGLNIYGKSGIVLPVTGTTIGTFTSNPGTSGNAELRYESETVGQLSLGFSGTIGASYAVSDNLSVFGELNGIFLGIKQKQSVVTSSTADGTETIDDTTPTYFTTTDFVDEITPTSNGQDGNPNLNQPDVALASKTNFSATFINIGITFNF